eukprot:gene7321-8525_t
MGRINKKVLKRREHQADLQRERLQNATAIAKREKFEKKRKAKEEEQKNQMVFDEVEAEGNKRGGKKLRRSSVKDE